MSVAEAVPPAASPPSSPDGDLDVWMTKKLGHSWRTTLHGYAFLGLMIASGVVQAEPTLVPRLLAALITVAAGVVGANGLRLAADARRVRPPPAPPQPAEPGAPGP